VPSEREAGRDGDDGQHHEHENDDPRRMAPPADDDDSPERATRETGSLVGRRSAVGRA
jgi:hypothetical protein